MNMLQLKPIEHKSQRVLTSQQIAEAYETDERRISENFTRNSERYEAGKHYFLLIGEEKRQFINHTQIADGSKNAANFYLWTEKGALLHAKSLNTDRAWEVYEKLVDVYFKAKEMFSVPQTLPEALRLAADLAEQIQRDAPKVLFADKCMTSGESILIRELAKIACKDGLNTGEHRLYRALRQWKLLNANNEPYQQYINAGYFEIVETPYDTVSGVRLARTTKVLPKGQQYIINKLHDEAI